MSRRSRLTRHQAAIVTATTGGIQGDYPDQALETIVGHVTELLMRESHGAFTEQQAHRLIFARWEYACGRLNDGGVDRTPFGL